MNTFNPSSMGNPLRQPAALFRRYTAYFLVTSIILSMSLHLLVLGTDWSRIDPGEIYNIAVNLYQT